MNINDKKFDELLNAPGTQLIDFWAEWCGPCKRLSPIIERLESEFKGKAGIYKLNVDEHPASAGKMGIRGIPTMILVKDGVIKETIVGAKSEDELRDLINKHL